jgi:hypothetical protein
MESFVKRFIDYAQARDTTDIAPEQLLRHLLDLAYRCEY